MLNGPDELSREELLELASIEMLGALDEVDSARLERGLRSAPPSLVAEVVALQERLASTATLRATDVPPASLRLRVLARLAEEAESDARAAAPIATIGPARAGGTNDASARADELADALVSRLERATPPVSVFWRAAALFLVAALAVTLYFNRQTANVSEKLVLALERRAVEQDIRALAPALDGFDFNGCEQHRLRAVPGTAAKGEVQVFVDRNRGRVLVVAFGIQALPRPMTLEGYEPNEPDAPVLSRQIMPSESAYAELFELPADAVPGRFELRDSSGTVIFSA
ncbi:MAG: hypothetical protein ACKO0W_03740 [Planctomycetota bacterium]